MSDDEEKTESEFGSGVVVCLAKFSEHMGNRQAHDVYNIVGWLKQTPEKQKEWEDGNPDMKRSIEIYRCFGQLGVGEGHGLSRLIWWMNGASDHFYDLDEERAPQPLRELKSLTLLIGHGNDAPGDLDPEHVDKIHKLWKESCLAVDRQLGVEDPEWGQW